MSNSIAIAQIFIDANPESSDKNKRKAFEYMREHENVNVFDQQDLDEQLNG